MGVGTGPRFGIEEEFLVVDRRTRTVAPRAATVIERGREMLGDRIGGEITKLQIEARTDPCHTAAEAAGQLDEARRVLADAADRDGLAIVATGTPVLGDFIPPVMTTGPRQDRGNETFRGLHDELAICALHVHVEIPDRDRAVLAGNHLRPWLPALIALGANSPFWAERDTGYASWRTLVWGRWPVAGPPPHFTSADHYDQTVAMLHEVGSVVDVGTIFWDIRPSAHVPTLEVRVCDVPMTARASAMTGALIRALTIEALAKVADGDPGPEVPAEMLRLAYWRAARDGLGGHGIDPLTGRLVRAAALAEAMVTAARPALEDSGEFDAVATWLKELVHGGDGAARQRAAAADRGSLEDVVDFLIDETAGVRDGGKLSIQQ